MVDLEPDLADLALALVRKAVDKRSLDFMTIIGNVVPITLISGLVGFRDSDLDRPLEAAFDSTTMIGATTALDELEGLVVRSREIREWVAGQLTDTLGEPSDDILGAVARGVAAGAVTEQEGNVFLHSP